MFWFFLDMQKTKLVIQHVIFLYSWINAIKMNKSLPHMFLRESKIAFKLNKTKLVFE